jgi:hypothetical protein
MFLAFLKLAGVVIWVASKPSAGRVRVPPGAPALPFDGFRTVGTPPARVFQKHSPPQGGVLQNLTPVPSAA